ncbi:MAG: type I-F CRISPR-associated protein Csy2 [Moraxella sp.]|nr:type I-F CRISPR-associated protein Csy2 [Moraxella sp.]
MSYIYPQSELIGYLLLERIQIINANAISSPLTYGFPAITGFAGATHALSRKLAQIDALSDFALDGVMIACHECQVQSYRNHPFGDFSFVQTRNPLLKTGKTAPIIEEGRCHLVVSLVVGVYHTDVIGYSQETAKHLLCDTVSQLAQQQRFAGGSVSSLKKVSFFSHHERSAAKIKNKLRPAFVLMDAHQELSDITQELQEQDPNKTALDALIAVSTLYHNPPDDTHDSWHTTSVKTGRGWLVPMPMGFVGISPLFDANTLKNSRSQQYPSQYVEAVYGLGKWKFVHFVELTQALWFCRHDPQSSLYLVTQQPNQP